jgi:glutathione S-transferase
MPPILYWQSISHPSQAARKMLDIKGIEYRRVDVLPLNQRLHMRLAGFRGGTVPGLKLDGEKIQGSRKISRALDARWPEPALFPADPELRARVEEAERWGDEQFQPVPRRLFRYGAATDRDLRRKVVRAQGLPAPDVVSALMAPVLAYYTRSVESDGRRPNEHGIRADLAALPAMLDHVDELLAEGTLSLEPPNAATLQLLATVRLLGAFEDLRPMVHAHACWRPAEQLFAEYKAAVPSFIPSEWLELAPVSPAPRP